VTVNVLANDPDVDNGAVKTVSAVSVTAGEGTVSIVGNQVRYNPSPDLDYLADDESLDVVINYTMEDEHGVQSSSTLTVTVTGITDGTINGTEGNDILVGTPNDDSIFARGGDDSVFGLDGNDRIRGGDGNDSLNGEGGNDLVEGGNDDDVVSGGDGFDTLNGDAGSDSLSGGNDGDFLSARATTSCSAMQATTRSAATKGPISCPAATATTPSAATSATTHCKAATTRMS
jgi:Ca2+-binding RTX toxin-like protein